jgi:hypothetical protein
VFDDVGRKKKKPFGKSYMLLIPLKKRELGDEDRMKKAKALSELERYIFMEEVSWRQKSSALWLREEDKCMKFSHEVANFNKKKNSIDSLLIDGTLSTNPVEISEHLSSLIKSCMPSNLSGGLSWMTFPLILLVVLRLFG